MVFAHSLILGWKEVGLYHSSQPIIVDLCRFSQDIFQCKISFLEFLKPIDSL